MQIVTQALTPERYARFGDVVMAGARGATPTPANQGTAARYNHLASLKNLRPEAGLNVSLFRCEPRTHWPFEVALLEKHPRSTQLFVPMNAARYVVIVAGGDARPDLSTLAAFVASGTQAVSYHPGVWHHPMLALDAVTDFTCLVYEDGSDDDCTVVAIAPEERAFVVL